ncbi:MAG: flagellar protein FliS [Lentisphaeria bacterium]
MNTRLALDSYAKVQYNANIGVATPHQLIQMLYDGAIQRISQAKGAMQYKQIELKGKKINEAILIVGGLRENLNREEGGDITANLDALYVYIQRTLAKSHINNDKILLDECSSLLGELGLAWKQIG